MCASRSRDQRRRQRLQVELQAARQHGHRNLLRVGRRQHELDVLGRLLERLQHRVERRPSTACALRRSGRPCSVRPSARSARCRGSRACCRCRCSTRRRARAGRRSGRRRCRRTPRRSPHGVAVTPSVAVEALRQDARDRRLADAARAGQQVGVMQPAARRARWSAPCTTCSCPTSSRERLRPPFAGENLVAHRTDMSSSDRRSAALRDVGRSGIAVRSAEARRETARRASTWTYMSGRSRRATKHQAELATKTNEGGEPFPRHLQ